MRWQLKRTQTRQDYGVLESLLRESPRMSNPGYRILQPERRKIEFSKSNRAEDFIAFLRRKREANEKRIVIILDNFRTHHARKVREEAEKLNISLVYLPPYFPDLNSPLNVEELKEAIAEAFKKVAGSLSFAKSWIEKFLGDKFMVLCT